MKLVLTGINKRIRDSRIRKKINQKQLAEKADITPAAISQIEKGIRVPTTPVLCRIADALDESLDFLTGRRVESFKYEIVSAETPVDLKMKVIEKIMNGWRPCGGVCHGEHKGALFHQAMIRQWG